MRPLSEHLARQRDEILAPANGSRRFHVVGASGSGKSALLRGIAGRFTTSGTLVLTGSAPYISYAADGSAQDRELADLDGCSDLIASLISSIDTFRTQHPESREATSRSITALARMRSPQRLHSLVVNATTDVTSERLDMLRREAAAALVSLAGEFPLAILIDDVHLLDGTTVQDWLCALLRQVPTLCTATAGRTGDSSEDLSQTDADQTVELRNMTHDEVRTYLRDRGLAFTDDEVRQLFDQTEGRGFAVATWCDLALDGVDVAGFTDLTGRVRLAVDQIPVGLLGYRIPLFALLAIAGTVTPELIEHVEDDTGQKPTAPQAQEVYRRLASRRFISAAGPGVAKGVCLAPAISDEAWRSLRETDPVLFRKIHSYAESYHRAIVDLDYEVPDKDKTVFSAWMRFEDPAWIRGVERWLDHAAWLDREQFEAMKPALVKIYLDAFWWWDDYLRSYATRHLAPALHKVAARQGDEMWVNAIRKFSDNYLSSWDEAVLRSDPGKWRSVEDSITTLLDMFGLRPGIVPRDPALRRIYILLYNFLGKASWYAGEIDPKHAEESDTWLAAAALACAAQEGEDEAENPNGWIASWSLLRRADIWSALDPQRAYGYLDGLDRQALADGDGDLRVNIAMLIGDLRWRGGNIVSALEAYSRALLISYAYNVRQELRRQAPNLYTKALYTSVLRRVAERTSALERTGEFEMLDTALDSMRQLFEPYWVRMRDRPNPPSALARFGLPVPPPDAEETSTLESEYVQDLEHLAARQDRFIDELADQPLSGEI
jgi:hypothetical protein